MRPVTKPTFLTYSKPLLTVMIQEQTPDDAINTIVSALYDDAEAFGIQLEWLGREYRDLDTLKRIFAACENRPIYITSYRSANSKGDTDEQCMELLLRGLAAGATICDVMGDLYCPDPHEITYDPDAVAKQKALIGKIHEMGGEVLMSSHLHAFFTTEQTLEVARAQIERGTDLVKIVGYAQDEDQLLADFATVHALKKALDRPFLFLANGAYSRLLRQIGPELGVCMYLCVPDYRPGYSREQPKLRSMQIVRTNLA